MLYATAGCRLFIADSPDGYPPVIPPGFWVEIAETEALGLLGGVWDIEDAGLVGWGGDGLEAPAEQPVKTYLRRSPMAVVMGNDPADPGQLILYKAWQSTSHFPFRMIFADGETIRSWRAIVTGLFEVFDMANGVMKLQADILPISTIFRT